MDYESILFGLQPLLNSEKIDELPIQDVYLNSYLTVLDQLAVSLRSPSNRTVVGSSELLQNLVRVLCDILDVWFHKHDENVGWLKLASELIRCVANSLVDDDSNRQILLGNADLEKRNVLLDYYVPQILKLADVEVEDGLLETLQMRTIVLVKNLCLENQERTKRFARSIRHSLLALLASTQHIYLQNSDLTVVGSELQADFIESYSDGLSVQDLLFFAQFIFRVSKTVVHQNQQDVEDSETEDDDPSSDIIYYLTQSLDIITRQYDESKQFYSEKHLTSQIQKCLLDSLNNLAQKAFVNKLIIMRRIITAVGYISANRSNTNILERPICFEIVRSSENGYRLAASLIILSNSISERSDVAEILEKVPLDIFIASGTRLMDPIQFQGYLDIIKKLLTPDNAIFLPLDSLSTLCKILKTCHDQTKFFKDLSPLLDNLLKKLLTVLPSSSVQELLQDGKPLLDVVTDRDSLISCLALDKLIITRTEASVSELHKLWDTAFKFRDSTIPQSTAVEEQSSVSELYLFQLAKACGLYLRKHPDIDNNLLLNHYLSDVQTLLEAVQFFKNKSDRASQSVYDNGKYVACMAYKSLEDESSLTEGQRSLRELARSFFN